MHGGKTGWSLAMALAALATATGGASAEGKPFPAPEMVAAQKVIAPNVVVLSYRCKPNAERTLNIGLTAEDTAANLWVEGRQLVCNNKNQRFTAVMTDYQNGHDRKLKPGERATTWLSIYVNRSYPVARQMRTLTVG
ncbi:hypothetical protein [Streptomyces melanogenes]|uniref:hypothetical protein n=1 Tax=Streptomyces melanogenes TaxID=67326 RepID=UPI00167D1E3F|nr:hypothetical protein [Streptomyces melanogenes]GGP55739.1 hypothetical protein GCM10010278_35780 [Streptomyces melanogenes]